MNPEYIIVQAGGKGSRMQTLTRNKPKALVPVNNLPMIFHLFRKYSDKKFIIIGDYKYEVLKKYLEVFANVKYEIICATGNTGTCSGINDALKFVPDNKEFLLIWCDLVLPESHEFPIDADNYIGVAKDFLCRWSFINDEIKEEKSSENGVAGYFIFKEKSYLAKLPDNGEFVRWLRDSGLIFKEQSLYHTHEYGLYSEWSKLPKMRCRPFNEIEIKDNVFIKRPVDEQGEKLAKRERAWYEKYREKMGKAELNHIPIIHELEPLTMDVVNGKNVYEYDDIPKDQKSIILKQLIDCLDKLHNLDSIPSDKVSFDIAYITKTKDRLNKVRNLIPFANNDRIKINGRKCRNVFYQWDEVEKNAAKYFPDKFVFIHGDCTFSNIILKNDSIPVFIDPRGYFGNTEIYGDEAYDWVKLYYSLFSNYDQFNLKRFSLDIGEEEVYIQTESNHWEDMEDEFFELLDGKVTRKQMKFLLAITWLSLTTYAWEDYDSICGAFYKGLLYLEESFMMSEQGTGDSYFGNTIRILSSSLKKLDMNQFEKLIEKTEKTLNRGHKIVVTGLGKNVPICEKFVGTMLSLGLAANFLHTNTAVHGDLGMIKNGDFVIILTKSGDTVESVYLTELLRERDVDIMLLTFCKSSRCEKLIGRKNCIIIDMEHEGDMWNIVPNNSTTLNLIVLQGLAMSLAKRMNLQLEKDFKPNHPGGAIGKVLSNANKT